MIVGARIVIGRWAAALPGYTPSEFQKVWRTLPKHQSRPQAMRRITYATTPVVVVFAQQHAEHMAWHGLASARAARKRFGPRRHHRQYLLYRCVHVRHLQKDLPAPAGRRFCT
jgi:hypothetical protein